MAESNKELDSLEKQKEELVKILEKKKEEEKKLREVREVEEEIRKLKKVIEIKDNQIKGTKYKDSEMVINNWVRKVTQNPIKYIMFGGSIVMFLQGEWFAGIGALIMAYVIPFMLKVEKLKKEQENAKKQ